MHEPIIECYHLLRQVPNLVIVAGSGMGEVNHDYQRPAGLLLLRL